MSRNKIDPVTIMMRSIGFPSQPLKVFDEAASVIAENLTAVEHLLTRLEAGVRVANNGRATVRDLYVVCRRQREVLAAALRLELE